MITIIVFQAIKNTPFATAAVEARSTALVPFWVMKEVVAQWRTNYSCETLTAGRYLFQNDWKGKLIWILFLSGRVEKKSSLLTRQTQQQSKLSRHIDKVAFGFPDQISLQTDIISNFSPGIQHFKLLPNRQDNIPSPAQSNETKSLAIFQQTDYW